MGTGIGKSKRAHVQRGSGQEIFLVAKLKTATDAQPEWEALSQLLLTLGGEAIAAVYEEDILVLLEDGKEWPTQMMALHSGKTSACHENAAALYEQNPKNRVVTGWALSMDGIWRQHSWCVTALEEYDVIVETTIPRVSYYGAELDGNWLDEFLANNL